VVLRGPASKQTTGNATASRAATVHDVDAIMGGRVSQLRFGAADYISTRPLLAGLRRANASLHFESPAALVDSLARGRYDAALVPSIEYLRGAGNFLVEGPALVSRAAPGGMVLVSQKPIGELERVAVGEFCRTPVAALRIVLGEQFGIFPDLLVEKRIEEDDWRDRYDAALLTADAAFRETSAPIIHGLTRYNISEMWRTLTHTPLVHAVWVCNDASHLKPVTRLVVESCRAGLDDLSSLANEIAGQNGIDAMTVHDYLSRAWSYDLGGRELEGLRALNDFSCRYDLIRENRLSAAVAAKA
jgi:chorismate dehydratase